jgi:hypothetical protein
MSPPPVSPHPWLIEWRCRREQHRHHHRGEAEQQKSVRAGRKRRPLVINDAVFACALPPFRSRGRPARRVRIVRGHDDSEAAGLRSLMRPKCSHRFSCQLARGLIGDEVGLVGRRAIATRCISPPDN